MRIRGFKVAGWVDVGSEGGRSGSAALLEDEIVERVRDCLLM